MKHKFYSDYDGAIVDFLTPWLNQINTKENLKDNDVITSKNMDEPHRREIVNRHYGFVKFGNYYQHVDLLDGALEFLEKVSEHFDIVFVTSSMSGDQKKYKYIHIEENFDGLYSEIIGARKKFPHTGDGAFFDDNIGHVEKHCQNTLAIETFTPGILFNFNNSLSYDEEKLEELKNTYDHFHYATTFEEVFNILDSFKEQEIPQIKTKKNIKKSNTSNKQI